MSIDNISKTIKAGITLPNNASDSLNPKSDPIILYRSENRIINAAIDGLVVRVYTYKKQYGKKTILLTGCGSSNGTSMISINLAVSLSLAGWKTLLVDADFRKGLQYKRLGRNLRSGLSDYLSGEARIGDTIYQTNHPNLKYAPCGTSTDNPVLLLSSEKMTGFMQDMSAEHEFVIIDCPSVTVVPDASVLFLNTDGIALVASMNSTTKKQLATAKREVEKTGDKYYGLIINCVDKGQYKHFYPQQDYFDDKALAKKHRKWIRLDKKRTDKGKK